MDSKNITLSEKEGKMYEIHFNSLLGLRVIVNDFACVSKEWKQYKFPKSKKVRVRKKWKKRQENFRLEEIHIAIKMENKLFVSSKIFEKYKEALS